MEVEVHATASLAEVAATRVAQELAAAIDARGHATLALSGGSTPALMYAALAAKQLEWARIDVVQVDERIAPDGDPARNLGAIRAALVDDGPLRAAQLHPMPVTDHDVDAAAYRYAATLGGLAPGDPPVLDVVHLGLGADGHTASLVPGDPVLDVTDRGVAVTREYRQHRRMTLTFPVLDAARRLVWLVSGVEKAVRVEQLLASDRSNPAGRIRGADAVLFTDVVQPAR